MIINSVIKGSSEIMLIKKIKLKPYSCSLVSWPNNSTHTWISNSYSDIQQHVTSISPTSGGLTFYLKGYEGGHQVLFYYEMVAVLDDDSEISLSKIINAGKPVSCSARYYHSSSLNQQALSSEFVGTIFNSVSFAGGYQENKWSSPVSPSSISSKTIKYKNNGSDASVFGCFIEIGLSARSVVGYTSNLITEALNFTINGMSFPSEWGTNWT